MSFVGKYAKMKKAFAIKDDHVECIENFKGPEELRYIVWIRLALAFMGSWPYKLLGHKDLEPPFWRRHLALIFNALATSLLTLNLIIVGSTQKYYDSMADVVNIILCFTSFAKHAALLFNKYFVLVSDFVSKIHLFHFKNKTEYSKKIFYRVHRICYVYSICIVSITLFCVTFYNIVPVCTNIAAGMFSEELPENKTFVVAGKYAVPFDYETNTKGYITISVFNLINSCVTIIALYMPDLFLSIVVFHLWGHLKILIYDLSTIQKPEIESDVKYAKCEVMAMAKHLKEIIDHHNLVMSYISRLSNVFGPMLMFLYFYIQSESCILLFMLSDGDLAAVVRYSMGTVGVYQQLFLLSVVSESLKTMGERLSVAIYELPWQYMDAGSRRTVLIMLMMSQRPLSVMAGGMVTVGVSTMATILKTTATYFLMLRTLNSM